MCYPNKGVMKVIRASAAGPDEIALMLKERRRLGEFIEAVERQDQKRIAKLLNKVIGPDDGTLTDLFLRDRDLLAVFRKNL